MSIIASGAGWTLDSDGLLTISMTGNMPSYDRRGDAPWYSNRDAITSVCLENGVTSIGAFAFCDCANLTSVTIPDSVTSIGYCSFENCPSLANITIPNSVTSIESYAFSGCHALTSVTIPASVTSCSSYAFRNCSNLAAFLVDSSNQNYASLDGVLFNKSKTSIIRYPNGKGASYEIPDGVTKVGGGAFSYSGLTSVTIPDSVTSIGSSAFENCDGLTSVEIPDGVTTISGSAFFSCNNLASVVIPDSVTGIARGAFAYCAALTDVYYTGTQTQWDAIYIDNDSTDGSSSGSNAKLTSAEKHFLYSAPPIGVRKIRIGAVGNPLAAVAGSYNQLVSAFKQLRQRLKNVPADATNNAGTITGITMNGVSKGTSGVVNLGTVVTDPSEIAPPPAVKFTNASAVTVDGSSNPDYYGDAVNILQMSYAEEKGDNIKIYAEISLTVKTDTFGSDEGGWALAEASVEAHLKIETYYGISGAERKQWTLGDGTHTLHMQWQVGASALYSPFALTLQIKGGTATVAAGGASALVSGITVSQEA